MKSMMKPQIVLDSHNPSYADPIKVAKGEFLCWLWAVADDGKEG
jgi:hypothetical protein